MGTQTLRYIFDHHQAVFPGYLQDGVRLVWIVDPQQRSIVVHTQGSSQQTTLTETNMLDGAAVLPGFSLPLSRLFGE